MKENGEIEVLPDYEKRVFEDIGMKDYNDETASVTASVSATIDDDLEFQE